MWPVAVLLGDSQTQLGWEGGGWVQLLADQFVRCRCSYCLPVLLPLMCHVRRVDLLNRGLSGYNSRMLLPALPHLASPELLGRASMITLMLGSNDASLPDTNPEQAVPLEEFGDNLLR